MKVWTIFGAVKRFKSEPLGQGSEAVLPLTKYDGALADPAVSEPDFFRNLESSKPLRNGRHANAKPVFEPRHNPRELLEAGLSMTSIIADFLVIAAGFFLTNFFVQNRFAGLPGSSSAVPAISEGCPILLCASAIILWGLRGRELYSYRSLLAPSRVWHKLFVGLFSCIFGLAIISALVRTVPSYPWLFFVAASLLVFPMVYGWRLVLSRIVRLPAFSSRLRRRLVVIGGGPQTLRIQRALEGSSDMEFAGWVQANKPNPVAELEKSRLGSLHELGHILRRNGANVAVLTESESLQREGVLAVAKACENEHVQFKMAPHFFEVLVSGVRPENIGGVSVLGVDCLPLDGYRNRILKRTVDIVGALVGLVLSIPLIAYFGARVFMESPGPIFYRQIRQGRNGRLFYILKIRTMRVNAEADGKAKWTQQNDERRLHIGAFMRKYNIDEVPQFWNVLRGHMSLVGPRPERPELIARFKSKIPHYQARHMYRPGLTGWAQVNGWRGNTDLEERIRHDIWYLENWSIWLDFRIMVETFFRRDNAY
jgi:exopolysaccharide biosynthesis polyprenyl glycosylphosphotransferase